MLSYKARLYLETGRWAEACTIAEGLIKNENQAAIVKIGAFTIIATIKVRRGDGDALQYLLGAKAMAFETMEFQRIMPVLIAILELEWITGKHFLTQAEIDNAVNMAGQIGIMGEKSELAFWLLKARQQVLPLPELYEGYQAQNESAALAAAGVWARLGCPYEEALVLFEAGEIEKRKALTIVQKLGADAVYQKMKLEMRVSGVKNIPRGTRKTTQANPASVTGREVEVLKLLNEGLMDKEIAAALFISVKTVGNHISSILFKLDVNSRVKAVKEAARMKIIK